VDAFCNQQPTTYYQQQIILSMNKFRFLRWPVYKEAKQLTLDVLKLIKKLPKEYRFELGSQLIRAAFSVVLNIAEGGGRISDKELNRFLDIALGSVYETLAATDTLKEAGFISDKDFENILVRVNNISDQLGGFKKRLG